MEDNLEKQEISCDFLVVGSGGGALTAAITAALKGLKVVIVEKEPQYGGATARSGGGIWIPGSRHAKQAGLHDSREALLTYFADRAGPLFDKDRVISFLDNAPKMVDFIEANSSLKCFLINGFPDYYPDAPGGVANGRSLGVLAFDGRRLGKEINRLRRPMASGHVLGMSIGLEDYGHYLKAGRSLRSLFYVSRLYARYLRDRLFYGRSMRLGGGNAVVGSLAAKVFELGIPLMTSSPARRLLLEGGRVTGATVEKGGTEFKIRARAGVLLATGGFPHDAARRARMFPIGAKSAVTWALMPYGNTGDGIRMAEEVGAWFEERMPMAVALSPVSKLALPEGQLAAFPVFGSRAGPGSIAVTRSGRRFTDEARSYHSFGKAIIQACTGEDEAVAFVICDRRALRRFGLGYAHPFPMRVRRHIKSGYIVEAGSVQELAKKLGIHEANLEETVRTYNSSAERGSDAEFGRGTNAYDVAAGDRDNRPNPCVGPLRGPRYYGLRVYPGSVGTFAGLVTDASARVLDREGKVITGLYATGNDLSSITGGDYIGGGCTVGPAMTFGYIAARHAATSTPG